MSTAARARELLSGTNFRATARTGKERPQVMKTQTTNENAKEPGTNSVLDTLAAEYAGVGQIPQDTVSVVNKPSVMNHYTDAGYALGSGVPDFYSTLSTYHPRGLRVPKPRVSKPRVTKKKF
jgi:hypothetical protein